MTAANEILPGTWIEWASQVVSLQSMYESGAIIRQASKFSSVSGVSPETAAGLLTWLGSYAMHTQVRIDWEHGLWHPSALAIMTIETDDVPIDSVTTGFIRMVQSLGLDPIQDNVKEGPSGLIARLETAKPLRLNRKEEKEPLLDDLQSLAAVNLDTIEAVSANNVGNVRGLIHSSGRAFLSSLYDTPFFNAIDELLQHGQLHVRGKVDRHSLNNMNIAAYWPFYQGALANMLGDTRTQNNLAVLLRQLNVFWTPPMNKGTRRNVFAGSALKELHAIAEAGIDSLVSLKAGAVLARRQLIAGEPMIDLGVGIRAVNVNRPERLVRFAIAVAFWRIAEGSTVIELLPSDYAVADMLVHCHDMSARILEIASTKGKTGHDALKMLVGLTSNEHDVSAIADSMSMAENEDRAKAALYLLTKMSIITEEGTLSLDARLITGDVIRTHQRRWSY